ncbi:MAG: hypothetical protein SPI83_07400 [Rothia sp. (in: high G+C Gram-positive bacteria)]|nr:hypothetical protein [Rothia sp. (in: high G+C Gram-positive bacteria)]
MGLFSRKKTQVPASDQQTAQRDVLATSLDTEQAPTSQISEATAPASLRPAQSGAGEGLKAVVKLMRAKTEGQVTLNLTQNAGEMKYTLYQRGQEVESGLVTPDTEWFQAVADLYVEEEKSERGAWNRALIVVNPAIGSDAAVHASFMNTSTSKTHNLNYALDMGGTPEQQLEDRMSRISARLAQDKTPVETAVTPAPVEGADAEVVASSEVTVTEVPAEPAAQESADVEPAAHESADVEPAELESAEGIPADDVTSADDASPAEKAGAEDSTDQPTDEETESRQLPAHLDDNEFETEDQPQEPDTHTPVSALPASAPTLDAPMSSTSVDVAPSFSDHSQPKPSTTKKASGNLVLTEAEVVSRFAPAYQALFGAEGSARDVSTVLIRVRTLGSYYDALTHVRRKGFWEQVRTFDLVPEETLAILQLKADSYKEGHGSPLAINIRFTPGTPVDVSFDYADEEAFVRYPEHLPAQQYVEELRMFPRTGENIPAHMSEALASWTF